MKSDITLTVCVALVASALLFCIGAFTILSIKPLADNAKYLLPAIIISGLLIAPFIAWLIAPKLRPRYRRWPQ